MSKELEALERIGELKVGCHYEKCAFLVIDFLKDSYDYKIIETALKEYEGAKNHIKALNEERIENSLKLKALEIIKEKILDMDYFNVIADRCDLTYQEYELLRKVLK